MRISGWLAGCLLGASVACGAAQTKEYKDTYTAADAGQTTSPGQALNVLVGMYEYQLVAVAEAMPADKYNFAPTAANFAPGSPAKFTGVRTFAEQMTHLIGANYYFYSKATGAALPPAAKKASELKTKAEIVAALKESFVFAHAQALSINENALVGIEGADGIHTPATLAAFAVAHGYDHYGQLVEYLRMNGVVPPGSK